MAGPSCGALLADLGADVIKVEKLPGGDDTRRYAEPSVNGESAAFMMMNRNKRASPSTSRPTAGAQVLRRLAAARRRADRELPQAAHSTDWAWATTRCTRSTRR